MLQGCPLNLAAADAGLCAFCPFLSKIGSLFYLILFLVMLVSLGVAANTTTVHSDDFFSPCNIVPNKDTLTYSPWTGPLHGFRTAAPSLVPCLKQAASPRTKSQSTVMFASTAIAPFPANDASTALLTESKTGVDAPPAPRSKTAFQLAYPPPVGNSVIGRQRIKVRPRLLLQLHHISAPNRPRPTLDVLPALAFAPILTRKFPTILKETTGLGRNDLVVVSSEEYTTTASREDYEIKDYGNDGLETREVVATICQLKREEGGSHGKARIYLEHGSPWVATPLPSGCYEFVAIDEEGKQITVRWVSRVAPYRQRSGVSQSSDGAAPPEKKFNFCIIDATTRRHPIIATLTRSAIEVLDKYPSLPASSAACPPSSSNRAYSSVSRPRNLESRTGLMINTEDTLRSLIVVTGIWIALRENWSKSARYDDHTASPESSPPSSPSSRRCAPMSINHVRRFSITNPESQSQCLNCLNIGTSKVVRSESDGLQCAPTSNTSALHCNGRAERSGFYPRRADSTGRAFIQRAKARIRSGTRRSSHTDLRNPNKEADSEPRPTTALSKGREVVSTDHHFTKLISLLSDIYHKKEEEEEEERSHYPSGVHQRLESNEIWTPFPENPPRLMSKAYMRRDRQAQLPENHHWSKVKGLFHIERRKSSVS